MDDRRHFGQRSAVLLTVLLASCLLATGAVVLLRPPRFTSHQDEIAYMLQKRGIPYDQVTLSQNWRDTQNFYAYAQYSIYGADVIINLADGHVARGRVECRVKQRACVLYLAELGIINQQLPDLASDDRQAWLDWLDHTLPRLMLPGHSVEPAASPSGP
jgi:hypothetical protein